MYLNMESLPARRSEPRRNSRQIPPENVSLRDTSSHFETSQKLDRLATFPCGQKIGRPFLRGRPFRDRYVVVASRRYCGSTFLRPEATGGGAPVGNAAGALASRTITCAGASITFPPVAFAIWAAAPRADLDGVGTTAPSPSFWNVR